MNIQPYSYFNSFSMINYKNFFLKLNHGLIDDSLSILQRKRIRLIIRFWMNKYPNSDLRCLAYILATADFETDRSFRPIEEKSKGKGERYGMMEKLNGTGYSSPIQLFYRRGIIPLIWYDNYKHIANRLKVDILNQPQLVLDQDISIQILVDGMMQGWFTGQKLEDYFSTYKNNWSEARSVLKKSEKSELLKSLGLSYFIALQNKI